MACALAQIMANRIALLMGVKTRMDDISLISCGLSIAKKMTKNGGQTVSGL
jgi:hypothetical protein